MNPQQALRRAIELHSQILHSESQAISARDLSTIEEILTKKDESLEFLLSAKEAFGAHIDSDPDLKILLKEVIEHQQKNADSFRKLHIQESNKNSPDKANDCFSDRVSKAYRR